MYHILGLAIICLTPVLSALGADRPNIVLIVSDDQGYHDLGCYGNKDIKTPNLDRLSDGGVRLTDFYVTWPACTPSRGSILTGRYPQRNGTYDMFRNDVCDFGVLMDKYQYAVSFEMIGGMDTREILLPSVLKQAGYRSGIFGKWDLGQLKRFLPLARGFSEFYGFTNTGIDYWTHERYGMQSMRRGNQLTEEDKGTYCTYLFQREAERFLKENKDRQFFLYLPFNAPHMASNLDPEKKWHLAPEEACREYPEPKNQVEKRRVQFMASVTVMDRAIGRILHLLEENHLSENTVIIFFSDNGGGGPADNRPLRGKKGQLFEGGIRVPCIVHWPGHIPAGTVCHEMLSSLEVYPTLINVAGLQTPKDITLDGFDMMPILEGKSKSPRKELFWERRGDRAARVGRWKWVDSAKGSGLFDLTSDISEKRDLSKDKPEVMKIVKGRFNAWKKLMEEAEPRGPFRDY